MASSLVLCSLVLVSAACLSQVEVIAYGWWVEVIAYASANN